MILAKVSLVIFRGATARLGVTEDPGPIPPHGTMLRGQINPGVILPGTILSHGTILLHGITTRGPIPLHGITMHGQIPPRGIITRGPIIGTTLHGVTTPGITL